MIGRARSRGRGRIPASACLTGFVLAALSAAPLPGRAQADRTSLENDIKAVFLYNFTRYLQWPRDDGAEPFTIVVLGESGIMGPLREIAKKKTVGDKPIVVRQSFSFEDIGRPRILFIADSVALGIARVLEKTKGTDTLTVGETEGLGSRGVAINFVIREETVKFEMNERVLREAGIRAGSQLLKLAILVNGADEGRGEP